MIKVNGNSPFFDPATGKLIAPGQVYHVPDPVPEKIEAVVDDVSQEDTPKTTKRKRVEE